MATAQRELPLQERLVRLLQHLGIPRAHFAARGTRDWNGLVTTHPESISSLSLVCPNLFDPNVLEALASRLLVLNGDQGTGR